MEFFIDRKTLLAINRLATEMLREMEKLNSVEPLSHCAHHAAGRIV